MHRPPPRSTLCPYTTLFRSERVAGLQGEQRRERERRERKRGSSHRAPPRIIGSFYPVCARAQVFLENRSEEHTSELQSLTNLVCRLLLEKKKKEHITMHIQY